MKNCFEVFYHFYVFCAEVKPNSIFVYMYLEMIILKDICQAHFKTI